MTKWTKASPSGVRWPAKWGEGEGWASMHGKETELKREPRRWFVIAYNHLSQKLGLRASLLIEELGGPKSQRLDRTIDQCHEDILAYFEKIGKRPYDESTREFRCWQSWLRARGSSLGKECDKLGLLALHDFERTLEQCQEAIQLYYKDTGKRPSAITTGFKGIASWLVSRGSSLPKECDQLGLPSVYRRDRTFHLCHQDILAHYNKTGITPSEETSKEFNQWAQWLKRNGSTLSKECQDLGLPALKNLERTLDQCHKEIQDYYNAEGTRPTAVTSADWVNWNNWLRRQESSLSAECDHLGVPVVRRQDRDLNQCHQDILYHCRITGKRPTKRISREFTNWDHWLRYHGSSLAQECKKLGL